MFIFTNFPKKQYTTMLPLKCNDPECSFELRKTSDSTLPPLIKAIEIFKLIEFPESETYDNDCKPT